MPLYEGLAAPDLTYTSAVAAIEKICRAFLDLKTEGSKDRDRRRAGSCASMQAKYPDTHFLGIYGRTGACAALLYVRPIYSCFRQRQIHSASYCWKPAPAASVSPASRRRDPADIFQPMTRRAPFAVLDNDLGRAVERALLPCPTIRPRRGGSPRGFRGPRAFATIFPGIGRRRRPNRVKRIHGDFASMALEAGGGTLSALAFK